LSGLGVIRTESVVGYFTVSVKLCVAFGETPFDAVMVMG
jgi:GTP cyclohydrolase III